MALGAISGASYSDAVNMPQVKVDTNSMQDAGNVDLNVTETPAMTTVSGSNQTGTEQEKGQNNKSASEKTIKDAISKANNKIKEHLTRCEFSYHDDTNRISIKVIDRQTDKVIKEIPPEETLDMIEKIWDLAGLLVDEKR